MREFDAFYLSDMIVNWIALDFGTVGQKNPKTFEDIALGAYFEQHIEERWIDNENNPCSSSQRGERSKDGKLAAMFVIQTNVLPISSMLQCINH